eukprot:TRINITY_DN31094_c0_g2_i1.p2 TRINITY_DN31094_c0_g2~~TRINITY_DN31094_c0_g2_i1.p2  ORF type:complete len:132 (-),score=1.38 TRINITY_DN31094_c0_g2_i1:122-469(-)
MPGLCFPPHPHCNLVSLHIGLLLSTTAPAPSGKICTATLSILNTLSASAFSASALRISPSYAFASTRIILSSASSLFCCFRIARTFLMRFASSKSRLRSDSCTSPPPSKLGDLDR